VLAFRNKLDFERQSRLSAQLEAIDFELLQQLVRERDSGSTLRKGCFRSGRSRSERCFKF
jgi:hypothetical protein